MNVVFSENAGTGERLDLMCGHFVLGAPHHRLLQSYLPRLLVVRAAERSASRPLLPPCARLASFLAVPDLEVELVDIVLRESERIPQHDHVL